MDEEYETQHNTLSSGIWVPQTLQAHHRVADLLFPHFNEAFDIRAEAMPKEHYLWLAPLNPPMLLDVTLHFGLQKYPTFPIAELIDWKTKQDFSSSMGVSYN